MAYAVRRLVTDWTWDEDDLEVIDEFLPSDIDEWDYIRTVGEFDKISEAYTYYSSCRDSVSAKRFTPKRGDVGYEFTYYDVVEMDGDDVVEQIVSCLPDLDRLWKKMSK